MVKNRYAALIVRFLGFAVGVGALTAFSVAGDGFMNNMAVFFTIQTNVFTTIMFGVLMIMTALQISKKGVNGEAACLAPSFQLAFTFYITITFIVYWAILSWMPMSSGGNLTATICNILLHGVIPVLAMVDCLLFMPHGRISKTYSFVWMIYPILYLIFIVIRAQVGAPLYTLMGINMYYPYMFVEPAFLKAYVGSEWVMVPIVLALVLLFWLFAKLYIYVDKKINAKYIEKHFKSSYYVRNVSAA